MFPYIDASHWHIANFRINPFAALVAMGLGVGFTIASARARRSGIDREQFAKIALWVIVAALCGAHIAKLFYSPMGLRMLLNPASLWPVFNGQASFGALIGGVVAAFVFLWSHGVSEVERYVYADAASFAMPFGWGIGRVGCYLVHDHPGIRTASFLGVRYPGGTRFDLGLIEALFLAALAALFLLLDRKPRPPGFYYVAVMLIYGLFRFFLDDLHVDPPRYHGWTIDRIGASIAIATGVLQSLELYRLHRGKTLHRGGKFLR